MIDDCGHLKKNNESKMATAVISRVKKNTVVFKCLGSSGQQSHGTSLPQGWPLSSI